MKFPRRFSALLCASLFAILILSTSSVARAQAVSHETRAYAESLTQSLMALHAQYRATPASGRAALKLQLRALAAERQQFTLADAIPARRVTTAITSKSFIEDFCVCARIKSPGSRWGL
jgi:hypothetical protein